MYYDHYGNNNMMNGFGWVFMAIAMIILFLGAVLVLRYLSHPAPNRKNEDAALDLLKIRYAKGEIEKTEFDEKRKDLRA